MLLEQLPHMTGDLEILPGFHDENRRGGSGGGHQTIPSERVVACALDAHPEETKTRARVGPQPGRRIAGPTGEHQTVNPPMAAHMAAMLVWIRYT